MNEAKVPSRRVLVVDDYADTADSLAQTLATPIDFEQLIADGILKKWGAWYQVLDWKRLPEHVRQKANTMKADAVGVLIQFA
jgi:hypoxanthine phosphoribosyltransferase